MKLRNVRAVDRERNGALPGVHAAVCLKNLTPPTLSEMGFFDYP
jgi:hypothetical protein